MPLVSGTRLGPYEILAPIGAGGMGEVYRARDPRMGRQVAIKIAAEQFSERFSREVHAVAALNHPNICHLYDVGPNYLVMELVEGPTLAERIKEGPVPLEEALVIAKQIADALEAAHEKGIVHRDLKPANIKIKPDGTVKVLDFGLAKMADPPESSGRPEHSPTLTLDAATRVGVVLGTAAYMPPEQARGKSVDRRADIWAFGVVLYEMLTGQRLFDGETVSDTLIEVATKEPDWDRIPAVPGKNVQRLLRRCLAKEPKRRLRDIGEAWFLLEDTGEQPRVQPTAVPAAPRRRRLPWIVATAATAAAIGLAFVHFREKSPVPELMRFQIPAPEKSSITDGPYVSPDGRQIAFIASSPDGRNTLWVRWLNSLESRLLAGTEGVVSAFWSPDSRFIAFEVPGKLKKVEASGGSPQTICDVPAPGAGAWSRDGVIVFGSFAHGLMRVTDAGGTAFPLTTLDSSRGELIHGAPAFLPDGRHFVYRRAGNLENSGIYLGSLDAKPEQQSTRRLAATVSSVVFAPSQGSGNSSFGYILFVREGSLMAQAFDTRRLEMAGEAVPIAEGLNNSAAPQFSASLTGVLAYRSGIVQAIPITQLTWFDRTGKSLGTIGEPGRYNTVAISPDGTRVAFNRYGSGASILGRLRSDIWVHEIARNTSTQFTFNPGLDWMGVWSPDGSRIVFASDRNGNFNLYQKDSSGAGKEDLLLKSGEAAFPNDWSPDGRFLLYATPAPKYALWSLSLTGDDHKPALYLPTDTNGSQARFSPDGRFVAYTSNASGVNDVYVQPFPMPSGGKWKIGSGNQPRWQRDGKELFYVSTDSKLMAVDVTTNPTFKAGTPKALFPASIWGGGTIQNVTRYDVTADGKRFLINALATETVRTGSAPPPIVKELRAISGNWASSTFTVVLNWEAGLSAGVKK
jgi:serine/threonine protein kinase